MKIDNNFFQWLAFAIRVIRILIEMFGDDNEKEAARNNHIEV